MIIYMNTILTIEKFVLIKQKLVNLYHQIKKTFKY